MPCHQSTFDFLDSIDNELVQYNDLLVTKGFSNTKLLAHSTYQDISELPVGHRRLLINEVSKIRSPHCKGLLAALDVDTMCTLSTPKSHNIFGPKELFPLKQNQLEPNTKINNYTYLTPMDKHLSSVQNDIESKEVEIQKQKCDIEDVSTRLISDDDLDSRLTCSFCHTKGHRKNRCSCNKCITSVSYGKMCLHKNELKELDTMKAQLWKLMKEKQTLDSECEKIQESILANSRSFPQAIHSTLMNSNKWKYLTMYGKEVVPLTKVINFDISVLQKYYNNCVPDDLVCESELFESIINMYDTKVHSAMNTLEMKLKNSVREIDNCIKKTHMNNISQPVATSILACTPASTQNNPETYMSSGSGHIENDFSIQTTPTQMSQLTQHFTPTPVTCNNLSNTQIYEKIIRKIPRLFQTKRDRLIMVTNIVFPRLRKNVNHVHLMTLLTWGILHVMGHWHSGDGTDPHNTCLCNRGNSVPKITPCQNHLHLTTLLTLANNHKVPFFKSSLSIFWHMTNSTKNLKLN